MPEFRFAVTIGSCTGYYPKIGCGSQETFIPFTEI